MNQSDIDRFNSKVGPPIIVPSGFTCRLWQAGKYKDGYGKFWLNGKNERAAKVALMIDLGDNFNHDPSLQANHLCPKQRDCVNPKCLYQGTHPQNMQDSIRDGTFASKIGERNNNSKLTDNDIREIRRRADEGESHSSIAEDFPVSRRQISRIVKGTRWAHLD